MQLSGLKFFEAKVAEDGTDKVTVTGSSDFVFVAWCEKNGALGSALFLNDVLTNPEILSAEVRRSWILRMYSLDYSQADIARMLCCSQPLVSRVCRRHDELT